MTLTRDEVLFDTRSVAPDSQVEFWAESVCKAFTNLQVNDVNTVGDGFKGLLVQKSFGKVSMASALAQGHEVELTREGIARANEETLLLHLQYQGHSNILHAGRDMSLTAGDIEIVDCSKPYRLQLLPTNQPLHEMLVLKVPLALMYPRVANIGELCGGYIPIASDIGRLVSQFIINAWQHRDGIDDEVAAVLGGQMLDLVSLAFNKGALCETGDTAVRTGHLVRMRRFIEAHLTDNSLSPSTVAEAACISLRYAHELFASEDQSISSYIFERRIEESEKMLSSEKYNHMTITDIAHIWGFKDSSHFGHVFKKKFGMSPNAYRKDRK